MLLRIILFLFLSTTFAKGENQIKDVLIKRESNKIVLTFLSSEFPQFKSFFIENPYRLVVDLNDSYFLFNPTVKSSVFNDVRIGKKTSGIRIVFDSNFKLRPVKHVVVSPKNELDYYKLHIHMDIISYKRIKYSKKNTKVFSKKRPVIVIDPGHGGKDPGAIGYHKSKEKDLTLEYAIELKRKLDKTKKFNVFLTRNNDRFISLGNRVKRARELKANLFISLHMDSAHNKNAYGVSIYTLSEKSSDKQAEILAKKENKSDIIENATLDVNGSILDVLISLSQRSSMNHAAEFSDIFIKTLKQYNISTVQESHRFAGFKVLTAPDIPSVLIELGFISNKYEERKLRSNRHRKKITELIKKSVEYYFMDHVNGT